MPQHRLRDLNPFCVPPKENGPGPEPETLSPTPGFQELSDEIQENFGVRPGKFRMLFNQTLQQPGPLVNRVEIKGSKYPTSGVLKGYRVEYRSMYGAFGTIFHSDYSMWDLKLHYLDTWTLRALGDNPKKCFNP